MAQVERLVAIVGPTASGKSELALRLARQFNGEIVCADSRTIYRGMDIGTAKPSAADQAETPHHLLDLINPDQTYSAAQFKAAALKAIDEIRQHGHLPIIVGGSGLYAYAVLYDYQFPAGARTEERAQLERRPLAELVAGLEASDPESAATIDLKNPRRVIRALETIGQPRRQTKLRSDAILVGLNPSSEDLAVRIARRTEQMIKAGLRSEVQSIISKHGSSGEVLRSPGYAEVSEGITDSDLTELISLHTRQLAKRQLTWLRRNPDIKWFEQADQAYQFLAAKLMGERL